MNLATRDQRILDVILSNLHCFYNVPEIVPPISPDTEGKGVPSDHNGVIATPHTNSNSVPKRNKTRRNLRPIPESLLPVFGNRLFNTDFSGVYSQPTTSKMVTEFQKLLQKLVEDNFPLKSILISSEDQPWFNEELRKLKRLGLMEYNRHDRAKNISSFRTTLIESFRIN